MGGACTYFSLHSRFARTTVTVAFLLLSVLLPFAYGWEKNVEYSALEIDDLKDKKNKK